MPGCGEPPPVTDGGGTRRPALLIAPAATPWQIVYYTVLDGLLTAFEGLALLASLDAGAPGSSTYRALAERFRADFVRSSLGELHALLFEQWLVSSTDLQAFEIAYYRQQHRQDSRYGPEGAAFFELIPRDAAPAVREQFHADLSIILAAGPGRDAARAAVAGVMQRTKDSRGDPQMTLAGLSAEIGLSAKYLGQEFQRVAGIPYRDYSRTLRSLHAAHILRTAGGDTPLKQIAHKAGYRDEGDFSRDFSTVFLIRPGAFRRRYTSPFTS